MEEDVLLRRDTAQQRCGASAVGGGRRSGTDDVECWMFNVGFWMAEGKGRPRIEEDWGGCFCRAVTRRSKGGGASAVGGGRLGVIR